jgi:lipopolysaccharide transport system ATP-binding protein
MSETVIRVENLGKKYRLGEPVGYKTLRESLMQAATAPMRWLKHSRSINGDDKIGVADKDDLWALKDVSFEVKRGEVVGIIGRNGAGKSTLLKILSRITEPTTGKVDIEGRVGSLLEVGTGFHPELTGRENIYLNGAILGMTKVDIAKKFDEIVAFSEIEKFLDTPVKRYSSGMYMRLAFAVAAHLEPEVLIVDEVLAVGDAEFQKKCLGKMQDVGRSGRTVLFVSHNMPAVRALCHRCVLLVHGSVASDDSVSRVLDAYRNTSDSNISQTSSLFPAKNEQYGLQIDRISIELIGQEAATSDLRIVIYIRSDRPIQSIGVGVTFDSVDGVRVSHMADSVTGLVIDQLDGIRTCTITIPRIGSVLVGGKYVIGIWLAKTRVEYIIKLDRVGSIELPERDIFHTGTSFTQAANGFVVLPIAMTVN